MMPIKQLLGEIDGRNVIGKGGRICVKYTKDGKLQKAVGILLIATEHKIQMNTTTAIITIDVDSILEIKAKC